MARTINMQDSITKTILEMAGQGYQISQIAKAVRRDKSSIGRRVKNLIKEGYIVAQDKGILKQLNLTNKGVAVIARHIPNTATDKDIITATSQTIRKHDLRIKLPLKDKIDNPLIYLGSKGIDANEMGLRNVNAASFTIEQHIIELMQQSAIVILPDVEVPVDTPIADLANLTYNKLETILDLCEQRTGIRFKRPSKGFFIAQIISQEIAFKNNEFAVASRDAGLPSLWVIEYDEVDGKPRMIIDTSHGYPELEAVHKDHSTEDAEQIQKNIGGFLKELKSGSFKEWKDTVSQNILDIAANLGSHAEVMKELSATSKNVNATMQKQGILIEQQSAMIVKQEAIIEQQQELIKKQTEIINTLLERLTKY